MIITPRSPQPVPTNTIAELFLQRNMVREATAFLLEALEGDRAEDAPLQTKVIEINLITNPQVADAILAAERFTHYDRPRVAQLCERAGLYMRALQHYTEISDIKRVIGEGGKGWGAVRRRVRLWCACRTYRHSRHLMPCAC